ncbi:P1 family peptidase [bacterium]|nr:P1 family peptidase [bacterium]
MTLFPKFNGRYIQLIRCCFFIWITGSSIAGIRAERARDWNIHFEGEPGSLNAITDVSGVKVGHCTLIAGEGPLRIGIGPVRTGVTAILPRGKNYGPVFAATDSLNGNGEMTGTTWVDESGFLEEPILLTNTHSVGVVYESVIHWRRQFGYHDAEDPFGWASLPVVAETWDGRLNDIHGHHVKQEHVFQALENAASGLVDEGNVGGGTGMVCHRFKGGIGTASRVMDNGYTLGVLVQANYGRREDLTIAGVRLGDRIKGSEIMMHGLEPFNSGHSIVVIIATDAPLLPHQLKRVARRSSLGIGRTGGYGANSSGDLFLAFSTASIGEPSESGEYRVGMLSNNKLDPFFQATIQCVEESVLNAMVAAKTMVGINDNTVYELPKDQVLSILGKHRIIE